MVTVTDTAHIAGQNDEREQKSMDRETYEIYSAAEPEKIDLIAFLAEYFQEIFQCGDTGGMPD